MCSEFLTNNGELLELCMRTCVVWGSADINMTTKAHCMNIVNWMGLFLLLISPAGRYHSQPIHPKPVLNQEGFFSALVTAFGRGLLHWPTCFSMNQGGGGDSRPPCSRSAASELAGGFSGSCFSSIGIEGERHLPAELLATN